MSCFEERKFVQEAPAGGSHIGKKQFLRLVGCHLLVDGLRGARHKSDAFCLCMEGEQGVGMQD